MIIHFNSHLQHALSLEEIQRITVERLQIEQANGNKTAYVAGAITADGKIFEKRNMDYLKQTVRILNKNIPEIFWFSSSEVFNKDIFQRIKAKELHNNVWFEFWRNVLKSGGVDQVWMTHGWKRSTGAMDEYVTAKLLGIHIVDMEKVDIKTYIK